MASKIKVNTVSDAGDNTIISSDGAGTVNITATSFIGDGSSLTGVSSVGGATGVDFNDNVKARFGTGNDLEIYHDGSHSFIKDGGTGDLRILATDFRVKDATDSEFLITGTVNAGVALYHDNSIKLQTTSTGVNVTGALTVNGSALASGITEADQWRLTSSFTGDASPISSNLSRVNTDGFGYIGTGMSQSSGVFTFPSTGIWLIKAVARFHWNSDSASKFNECKIQTTTNNSTYDSATNSSQAINVPYNQAETNSYGEFIFDVTSTSTHKVRFSIDVQNSGVTTAGNTGQNLTYFTFIRLGDT
jgi:hypothetical protein